MTCLPTPRVPEYPYECAAGHETLRSHPMGEKKPKSIKCKCGKRAKRTMNFPFAIMFKGSGCTTRPYGEQKVSWSTVEKAMQGAEDNNRREEVRKAKIVERLASDIADTL